MGLYEQVRDIAKTRGYSINKLEKELGFARSSINKFNTNKPSIEKIQQIADFLDVSVEYLMTGEEPNFNPYSEDMAHLVAKTRNDTELSKALLKYFELSDVKKNHVVELINLLSEK